MAAARSKPATLSEEDRRALAQLILEAMPPQPEQKTGFQQFLANWAGFLLTLIIAVVTCVYGFGSQGDKINNIDANLSNVKATMVSIDLLNSKLGEVNAKLDQMKVTNADTNQRLERLENKAMNGRE